MTNIFKKMLNELPAPQNKIIPTDQKDQAIANQMNDILNWKIVESRSDKHPKFGYPMGQILCRNLEEAEDYIKNSQFNDCYIKNYENESVKK